MNKPEFGGMFFDEAQEQGAVMYWGARAVIIRQYRIEIYRDRQNFTADNDERKQEFLYWLNNDLIPYLERQVQAGKTKHIEAGSRDGHFHAIAEDRNSGGYLYIGAWCK